jgi:3-deoxy-D-manno-octulosonic-acid transferase
MVFLYTLFIRLFALGIRAAAIFDSKAKRWALGRRGWRARYHADFQNVIAKNPSSKTLWLHAASLGEFEQGRPLIEAVRARFPDWRVVLTFFSPSGYELRRDYPLADFVAYLPADTPRNARDFLDLIKPDVAIFVKYEFWANYLFELKKRDTPTLLVSALFRPSQPFFRWYGALWRRMLGCFSHVFVQNESSGQLLQSIDFQNFSVVGDTRVDRVLAIAATAPPHAEVAAFAATSRPIFIAGSSWAADEAVFLPALQSPRFAHWKAIVAPHEPSAKHVERLKNQLARTHATLRELALQNEHNPLSIKDLDFLLIDGVGLLNTLYRYGTVAYIGGGFGKGIHNTLEPAAFGLPIVFGPNFEKFEEARQFVARGGAFVVRDATELAATLARLEDPVFYQKTSEIVRAYLAESRGATARVLEWLGEYLKVR